VTPSVHAKAWAGALATEHLHQRELLATFRGELRTFAMECAQTVAALDVFLGAATGVAEVVSAAASAHEHATIVRDVARRLSELREKTMHEDVAEVYAGLEHEGDLAASVVQRARNALKGAPKRSDRELLNAIVASQGVRAGIEKIIGPAPLAALTALAPLARQVPRFSSAKDDRPGRRELVGSARDSLLGVLQAGTQVDGDVALAETANSAALAASLHEAVPHVREAARAVEEGRIEQAIAEARRLFEADFAALQRVIDGAAEAPATWLGERRTELAELREEVREKLERVEHTRRLLAWLLPNVQTVARALAIAGRVDAVEGQFSFPGAAITAEAAQLLLLIDLGELWDASLPAPAPTSHGTRASSRRIAIAGVALLALAGVVAAVFALSGGGSPTKPKAAVSTVQATSSTTSTPTTTTTTTTKATPAAPAVSPVHAEFKPLDFATYYAVSATAERQGTPTYTWSLSPPKGNASCNRFGPVPGKPNQAVWHHADTDGCNHALMGPYGHTGTVTVIVKTSDWECTATFFGTITRSGPPAQRCRRV
jgi:hypothetical protein